MTKENLIKIIGSNFKPKDVGIGILDCISEKEQVENLANELLEAINYNQCCKSDSELLKSVDKLDYDAWKDKLGLIKDVDKSLYKLNGNYITINEVLDMYDVYCATF